MAVANRKLLEYIARLSQAEKRQVYDLAGVLETDDLRREFQQGVAEAAVDRIVLAISCLELARALMASAAGQPPSEAALRCAISRAYYAAHHAIRAICLYECHWDPDGHAESVNELRRLLREAEFQRHSGLGIEAIGAVNEAMNNRHVADYSPYTSIRRPNDASWIPITGDDWIQAVEFNVRIAETLVEAAERFVFR